MALRNWLARIRRKASSVTSIIVQYFGLGHPVYPKRDFYNLAREGFERNVYVYRGVMTIAQACAGIPWLAYKRGRGGRVEELDDHPLIKLIRRPNPEQGGTQFMRDLVAYWVLAGNAYIEALRPDTRRAPPRELWLLRPDRVKVIPDPQNRVGGYRYEVGGLKRDLPRENVLHLKMFAATDDWYGLSPVAVVARVVDQQNAGEAWNLALLQNSGKPPFALVYKGVAGSPPFLDEEQFERLKRELREEWTGPANAGLPKLLEGGLEIVKLGFSPTDMDWLQGDLQAGRKIAIALGVPPELLGDASQKTYSNYREARASFYTETILPLMDELRDQLNNWLVPMFDEDGLYLDYDRDEIEALQEDRGKLVETLNKAWWLSLNERRLLMGYEEVEGGDEIYIPSNMQPLSALLDGGEPFGPAESGGGAGDAGDES